MPDGSDDELPSTIVALENSDGNDDMNGAGGESCTSQLVAGTDCDFLAESKLSTRSRLSERHASDSSSDSDSDSDDDCHSAPHGTTALVGSKDIPQENLVSDDDRLPLFTRHSDLSSQDSDNNEHDDDDSDVSDCDNDTLLSFMMLVGTEVSNSSVLVV